MEPKLKIENLHVVYDTKEGEVQAVDGLSLELNEKEVIGIAGETGSGKTTLALSILRILPTNGRIVGGKIYFDGADLLSLPEEELLKIRQAKISLIIQQSGKALHPMFESGWQVAEAIYWHEDATPEELSRRVSKIFDNVWLGKENVFKFPEEMSMGMRQRALIALAISTNPELIIADEPFKGLDVIIQRQIIEILKGIKLKYKPTMLLMSHNINALGEIAHKLAIMYAGQIFEVAKKDEIFQNPKHPYTKGLIGAIPSLKRLKRRLISMPGNLPSMINPPKGCRFWPRCPYAKEICKREAPKAIKIGNSLVRCHFAEEVADISPWDFWG